MKLQPLVLTFLVISGMLGAISSGMASDCARVSDDKEKRFDNTPAVSVPITGGSDPSKSGTVDQRPPSSDQSDRK